MWCHSAWYLHTIKSSLTTVTHVFWDIARTFVDHRSYQLPQCLTFNSVSRAAVQYSMFSGLWATLIQTQNSFFISLLNWNTDPLSFPPPHQFKMESIKSKLKLATRSSRNRTNDGLKYAWPALKLTLTVFEKTLGGVPIPGLKGSVGGLLELAKTAEVCAKAIDPMMPPDCLQIPRQQSKTRTMSSSFRIRL